MKNEILLMDVDPIQGACLAALLDEKDYPAKAVTSLPALKEKLRDEPFMAVLMDIDSVDVDNRRIRELVTEFPGTPFFCVSKGRFHPELEDVISQHIYACLSKPIDPEELFYWLKCVRADQA